MKITLKKHGIPHTLRGSKVEVQRARLFGKADAWNYGTIVRNDRRSFANGSEEVFVFESTVIRHSDFE